MDTGHSRYGPGIPHTQERIARADKDAARWTTMAGAQRRPVRPVLIAPDHPGVRGRHLEGGAGQGDAVAGPLARRTRQCAKCIVR